ncbi:MAG: DUF2252 domain-containing protein [Acidimicrobiales bacterium]|nr:DUF2252 domain-containing protein [Acidimicrobiales bacterium]
MSTQRTSAHGDGHNILPDLHAGLSVAERRARGRSLRQRIPRSSFADWRPPDARVDVVAQLAEQELTRVPELVPVRHERMAVSPFTFFRGAAKVFSADIAERPRSGLTVQLCGDAHLSNFGGFASPERVMVFDLNDFDETLPGPFEWDLLRLSASFEIAARENGLDGRVRGQVQRALVAAYAGAMAEFAPMSYLEIWYAKVSATEVEAKWGAELTEAMHERVAANAQKARGKDRLKAFKKLTTVVDGELRFVSDPPLLVRVDDIDGGQDLHVLMTMAHGVLHNYRRTLQADRRVLLDRYEFVDLARKVVGVGSVGTRCWVALMIGKDTGDPLFLQIKEAEASVMEPHLGGSGFAQHGQRVVEGQRLIQSASDIFLGWDRHIGVDGLPHDYYFRQLWDWKASPDIAAMDPAILESYARLCGYTLARAHARTGDAAMISGYLGTGKVLGEALTEFAANYADRTELDHATFVAAVTHETNRTEAARVDA